MADKYIDLSSSKAWAGYIKLDYAQSVDGNYTEVTVRVSDWKTDGYDSSCGMKFNGTVTIGNDSYSFQYDEASTAETDHFRETVTVYHDSSGNASLYVACTIKAPYPSTSWGLKGATLSGSETVWLPQIDRSGPSISLSVSNVQFDGSSGSFKFSASSNVEVGNWYYKLDSGSWQYFDYGGTSAEYTITGLSAGTHTIQVLGYKASNGISGTSSQKSVDLTQPTISFSTSNITASGFKISAVSDVTAKNWYYSLDGGSTWTLITSTAGTSASKTLTGLSANTVYNVKVKATKSSNNTVGYSSTSEVKTLGGTILHSVEDITADAATAQIPLNLTVYDAAFYYKVVIKNASGTTMLSVSGKKFSSAGTKLFNITLTATERTTLLNSMPKIKSFTGTLYLSTYTNSACTTQVGGTVNAPCTVLTTEANSKPTFTALTYKDTLPGVVAITGNNQVLVQNCSFLEVTCTNYAARNGASITSFSASIGDASVTSTSAVLSVGTVNASGNVVLTVKCIDSRGYATTISRTLNIIPYSRPTISNLTLRRRNEIEGIIELSFEGSISEIKIDGSANLNSLYVVGYSYRRSDQTAQGSFVSLYDDVTITGNTFSYETNELMNLDTESSFYFHFRVQDLFGVDSSYDVDILLLKGTPLIAIRKRTPTHNFPRFGINTADPQAPLDVGGNIHMNGCNVMGFVKALDGTEYLDDITEPGIYIQATAANAKASMGYPVASAGVLEVSGNKSLAMVQKYFPLDGSCVCINIGTGISYGVTWLGWKKITLTAI